MKLFSSRSSRQKAGGKKKKKQNNKRFGTAGILCSILVLIVAGFFAYVTYGALNCRVILPNVYAYGVNLGGMSPAEAEAAMIARLEAPGSGVTLNFPNESVMELTHSDFLRDYDPAAAAEEAWDYGRLNGRVSPLKYAFGLAGSVELYPGSADGIDGEALKAAISRKAADINSTLVEGAYSVNGSSLTIIKGASGILLDEDEIYRLARSAFENGESSAEYEPLESAPHPLDLDDIHSIVCREPVDARFDSRFNILKSMDGISFDLDRARRLYDEAEDGAVISVTLTFTEPEVTTEALSALLYRDKLAEWTSTLTNNEVRSTNVELAANAVNGTVLLPGETFSYNDTVGERTTDRGFGAAAAYANGETVYEVGGGICQVSSAIYYCCLLADMEIDTRTCHLYTAAYVPLGMDATVSWGGPEFDFTNSSEYPVKIAAWREGDRLYCELYGTKTTDEYIEMSYLITDTYSYDTKYEEDESVSPGHTKTKTSGITGYRVVTYKSRFAADGSLISREKEATSVYSKRDQVILVAPGEKQLYDPDYVPEPTAEPTPQQTPEPTPELSPEPTPTEELPSGSASDLIWDI